MGSEAPSSQSSHHTLEDELDALLGQVEDDESKSEGGDEPPPHSFRAPWRRESGDWLFGQTWFARMTREEQEAWLTFREGVSMGREDPLRWREDEFFWMSLEDVVELSKLRFDEDDIESMEDLAKLRKLWGYLGGGLRVEQRLSAPSGGGSADQGERPRKRKAEVAPGEDPLPMLD